jgi:NADPH:quinone reductase
MDRAELLQRSGDLFNGAASGKLKLRVERIFSMSEAAQAHRQLEARKTAGKVISIP